MPIWSAITPASGPSSAPAIAAPMAVPSSSPRRSAGAAVASQARPAAHVQAPPTPWTNRAASSTTSLEAKPNTSADTLISASPRNTTSRHPSREARTPPGSAPTSVPSG